MSDTHALDDSRIHFSTRLKSREPWWIGLPLRTHTAAYLPGTFSDALTMNHLLGT